MPENYQNTNGDGKKHVTTNSNVQYMNSKVEKPMVLRVIYYDESVRLEFIGELPKEQQTEKRRYNYEKPAAATLLLRHKCQELYNAYKNVIIPALNECRNEQISVPLAGVNQLVIDTNVGEDGIPRPRIKLVKNIDLNSGIADGDNVFTYVFNMGEYILGYNEVTGDFKKKVLTYNELELFMRDLNTNVDATSNTFVHTERVVNRYWKDTLDGKLNKIGEKLGIDLTAKPRYQTGNGGQASIFDNPSKANTSDVPYNNISVSDLDALESQIMG